MWTPASVHHAIVRSFVDHGHAPPLPADAEAALHELADQHGVVLHPGTSSIWIAHPFSASPTAVWVQGRDRGWWAPCMWCALGVCVLAAPTATIHARYGGEAESVAIAVVDGRVDASAVVHFSMPPRDAW
ncbi:MAG TPA: organomercurial lyase, partial [Kofleriaceae bacterium]|nr:organomercurial lyase [Kofleriaceae bacterium]